MIKFSNDSHWYQCREGEPTPHHDADLRVARKTLLYPSVTSIDKGVFVNDFLDKWKINQMAIAASECFRQPHETPETYANRLHEASRAKVIKAGDFGTRFHKAVEGYPAYPEKDPAIHPWVDQYGAWAHLNVASATHREAILFDHELGVAGCCDFIGIGAGPFDGQLIMPDYKTQDVKTDDKGRKKPAFYDSWARQLAFYAVSYAKKTGEFPTNLPTCISLIFDSNEPSAPYMRVWKREEINDAYMDFVAGAYLFFSKRGYWPQLSGPLKLMPSVPLPL